MGPLRPRFGLRLRLRFGLRLRLRFPLRLRPALCGPIAVAGLAVLAGTGLGARPAHAHIAPAGSQTMLMAGWDTLLVDLDAAQPYVSRRFAVFVALHPEHPGPQDSLYRMTVTAVAGAGTIATPQRGHLVRSAGSPREWEGDIAVPTRGGWGLRFDLVTPKGTSASTMYPITVAAPNAIPVWQGWCMGLSPLMALLGFAVWQAGVLRRQLREEAAAGLT